MLRSSLIQGCRNLLKALNESGVTEVTRESMQVDTDTAKSAVGKVLEAIMKYATFAKSFGKAEKSIARIMSINNLDDPEWVAKAVKQLYEERPSELFHMAQTISFFANNIPQIMDLLAQEDLPANFYEKDPKKRLQEKYSGISVILIEEEGQSSNIDRVILALTSIEKLYDVCGRVEKLPADKLAIVACDSGSDKSFSLTGLSKNVERLRDVVISIWERAVYFRETQGSLRIKNIADSLPILEKISEMEKNNNLVPEEAETMRRETIKAVTGFLESGIITPEIYERETFNPRQLLAPEPKLLTHINQEDTSPTNNVHQPKISGSTTNETEEFIEKLNPEERRALRDKLKDEDNDSEN